MELEPIKLICNSEKGGESREESEATFLIFAINKRLGNSRDQMETKATVIPLLSF